MIEHLARNIIRYRWLVIAVTIALVSAAAIGFPKVKNATDYRIFFSENNPQLLAFEKLERTYMREDNILFVLAPKNGNIFTRENLAAIEQLTKSAWQIPYSSRVDSISNFQNTYAQDDDLVVQDLYRNARVLSASDIENIKKTALTEPLLANRLVSPQGHVAGVNVMFQFPGKSETENPEVVAYVHQLADKIRADYPQIEVYETGLVLLPNAFYLASQKDMHTLVPLAFLVVVMGLIILLRGWTSTLATLLVIFFSIATAMGLTGWIGIKLTPPSAGAPTIILTLGVANSVHILVTLLHAMRHGKNKYDAITESLRLNFQPVLITSMTTVIGFLSLNFSDAQPFHDLGNIVSMGIIASFILSITFLPAMIAVLPVKTPVSQATDYSFMDKFADFVIRWRNTLLWGTVLVAVALISFLPNNKLQENMIHYFDKDIPFRAHADFVSDNLGGIYGINYSLESGEAGGISDPTYLRKLESFTNWYKRQPEVIHVNSITDILKRLNKNMHGDDDTYYRLPIDRELAAQYLLLYEMSLPYGLDLNNQINVDKSSTRVIVTTKTLDSSEVIALEERAQQWLQTNMPELRTAGSSTTVMFSHIAEVNIVSMMEGTFVALILISFILMFALRSFLIGGISIIPNLIPPAMGFGLWGLFVGEIDVGAAIVAAMVLGIVVDDTVHFLSKYLRARREMELDSEAAVRYAFHSVGKAVWVTSLVLVGGFMVFTLSTFKMNLYMGVLTAIIVTIALAADFLFLPALLMKIDGKRAVSSDTERPIATPSSPQNEAI